MAASTTGMRQAALVATVAILTVLSTPSHAASLGEHARNPASKPPTDKVAFDVVKAAGSGCRARTAVIAVAPDNAAFTVTYSNYLARVGKGAPAIEGRKNCHLDLRVTVARGFAYAISGIDHRGFASLQAGSIGIHEASYFFQGAPQPAGKLTKFTGPYADNWQVSDPVDLGVLTYSRCGQQSNFNIKTELRVAAGSSDSGAASSFMAMDSTDGSVKTTFRLAWKHCG